MSTCLELEAEILLIVSLSICAVPRRGWLWSSSGHISGNLPLKNQWFVDYSTKLLILHVLKRLILLFLFVKIIPIQRATQVQSLWKYDSEFDHKI